MKTLVPLGSGVIMPALVAGYELTNTNLVVDAQARAAAPDWLFEVEQQAGGIGLLGAATRDTGDP